MLFKKLSLKPAILDFVIITVGALIAAAAIFFFMLPSHVAVGSASALAMVLANYIPLPVSALNLLINVILLIIGFILIGPEFGVKTVYTAIMVPVFMGVFEFIFPNFKSLTEDPLLDVICYILVVGIAMAILFSRNASSGGLDIVAKIMNKYLKMDLGQAVSVSGIAVALTSALCYDTKTVVLSVIGTYFGGMVLDYFIFGFGLKRRVCIISSKHDEFVNYILNELHSGATIYESYGAYDNALRKEIVTIVDKGEYRRLMDFIKKNDPKAFITVYSVNEMQYQPKAKR
nr:YitT family protein [Oscillospiraceae bacterium]